MHPLEGQAQEKDKSESSDKHAKAKDAGTSPQSPPFIAKVITHSSLQNIHPPIN